MGRASRQQKPGVTFATKNTSTNGLNMGTKEDKMISLITYNLESLHF